MIRLFPFACTSSPGEAALTIIAATIRWTNAGRRLTVSSAFPTHITLVRRRRGDETIGVISSGCGDQSPILQERGVFLARRSQPLNYSRSIGLVRVSSIRRVCTFLCYTIRVIVACRSGRGRRAAQWVAGAGLTRTSSLRVSLMAT